MNWAEAFRSRAAVKPKRWTPLEDWLTFYRAWRWFGLSRPLAAYLATKNLWYMVRREA